MNICCFIEFSFVKRRTTGSNWAGGLFLNIQKSGADIYNYIQWTGNNLTTLTSGGFVNQASQAAPGTGFAHNFTCNSVVNGLMRVENSVGKTAMSILGSGQTSFNYNPNQGYVNSNYFLHVDHDSTEYAFLVRRVNRGTIPYTIRSYDLSVDNLGNTGIGIKVAARKLDVNGEVRIRDLTTDTPTRIEGADADGDLGE